MDCPTACTALAMFYHRARCAVQAFGLNSLFKVHAVRCTALLSGLSVTQENLLFVCLCPLDILNCTTRRFVCQELFSKFLEFFSLALRLAFRCSVGQFLIMIIAAISEKSSLFFKKNEIFFSGVSRI